MKRYIPINIGCLSITREIVLQRIKIHHRKCRYTMQLYGKVNKGIYNCKYCAVGCHRHVKVDEPEKYKVEGKRKDYLNLMNILITIIFFRSLEELTICKLMTRLNGFMDH